MLSIGSTERFLVTHSSGGSFKEQVAQLIKDHQRKLIKEGLNAESHLWSTVYLSDAVNQLPILLGDPATLAFFKRMAVRFVQLPPAGAKIAMLSHHISQDGTFKKYTLPLPQFGADAHAVRMRHGALEHLFVMGCTAPGRTTFEQTAGIFDRLSEFCLDVAGTQEALIRTWLYIADIDRHYTEMCQARKLSFEKIGLGSPSRFPASTGIEGRGADPKHLVSLDAIIIKGLRPGQSREMAVLSHMNRTLDYGVTFARGREIVYGDRRHLYISGTASIDAEGRVMHTGDVLSQTKRTVENISVLLSEHRSELKDLAYIIAYVRDAADFEAVGEELKKLLPDSVPCLLLKANVCRPTWLVELEGLAIVGNGETAFCNFQAE